MSFSCVSYKNRLRVTVLLKWTDFICLFSIVIWSPLVLLYHLNPKQQRQKRENVLWRKILLLLQSPKVLLFYFFIGIIFRLTEKDSKKLILSFFFYLEEEVEEEPMSEESDVELDMEGVVEVNFNVFFFYLIWDKTFQNKLKLWEVLGKVFCKIFTFLKIHFHEIFLNSLNPDFFFALRA